MEWLIRRLRAVGYATPEEEFLSRLNGELPKLAKEIAILMAIDSGRTVYLSPTEWSNLRWAVLYHGSGPERDSITWKLRDILERRGVNFSFESYDNGRNFWIEIWDGCRNYYDYYAIIHAEIVLEFNGEWPWEELCENFSLQYLFSVEEEDGEVKIYKDYRNIRYLEDLQNKIRAVETYG